MHETVPQSLQELVSPTVHLLLSTALSCADRVSLYLLKTNKKHSEARSFRRTAPTFWNRLPDPLYKVDNITHFQQQLKSHLLLNLNHPLCPSPLIPSPPLPPTHTTSIWLSAWDQIVPDMWLVMLTSTTICHEVSLESSCHAVKLY